MDCFGFILSDFHLGQVEANKTWLVTLAETDDFLTLVFFKLFSTIIVEMVQYSFDASIAFLDVKENEDVVDADMGKVDADDLFPLEVVFMNKLEELDCVVDRG